MRGSRSFGVLPSLPPSPSLPQGLALFCSCRVLLFRLVPGLRDCWLLRGWGPRLFFAVLLGSHPFASLGAGPSSRPPDMWCVSRGASVVCVPFVALGRLSRCGLRPRVGRGASPTQRSPRFESLPVPITGLCSLVRRRCPSVASFGGGCRSPRFPVSRGPQGRSVRRLLGSGAFRAWFDHAVA